MHTEMNGLIEPARRIGGEYLAACDGRLADCSAKRQAHSCHHVCEMTYGVDGTNTWYQLRGELQVVTCQPFRSVVASRSPAWIAGTTCFFGH